MKASLKQLNLEFFFYPKPTYGCMFEQIQVQLYRIPVIYLYEYCEHTFNSCVTFSKPCNILYGAGSGPLRLTLRIIWFSRSRSLRRSPVHSSSQARGKNSKAYSLLLNV